MKTLCQLCKCAIKVEPSCDDQLVSALIHSDVRLLRKVCQERKNCGLQIALLFSKQWPNKHDDTLRIMTPFQFAAKNGLVEILDELLATGTPPEGYTCCLPMSPLFLACSYPQERLAVSMVKSLLRHGVDPDSCRAPYYADEASVTAQIPLIGAAKMGHRHVVQLLCTTHNPPVNVHAVSRVNFRVGPIYGVTHYDIYGKSALQYAVKRRHADVIRVLCRHGSFINMVNDVGGPSLLGIAAQNNDVESIEALCEFGGDPNRWYAEGQNYPILEASYNLHTSAIRKLLRQNAIVTVTGKSGFTSLHVVCARICARYGFGRECPTCLTQNQLDVLNILLEYRSLHGIRDMKGRDALTMVLDSVSGRRKCWEGDRAIHLKLLELLIKAGHPVPDSLNYTELHGLLSSVDFMTPPHNRSSPEKCCRVLELLLSAGCNLGSLESYCTKNGYYTALEVLKSTDILAYAERCSTGNVASLRRHAKLSIRDSLHRPLDRHISRTGLPQKLNDYVMLECTD